MAHAGTKIFAITLEEGKAFMGRSTGNMAGDYAAKDTIVDSDRIAMKEDSVLVVEPIL
jgi:hypothetical protein